MHTSLDTELPVVGRGDGSDPAVVAQHCADLADIMAHRAEQHAKRAKEYAACAEIDCATAAMRSGRAGADMNRTLYGVAMLGVGIVLGVALTVVGYLLVARVVHDTVGNRLGDYSEVMPDPKAPDDSTPARPHYARSIGSDVMATDSVAGAQGSPTLVPRSGETVAVSAQ